MSLLNVAAVADSENIVLPSICLNGRPRKTPGYMMPEKRLAELIALTT